MTKSCRKSRLSGLVAFCRKVDCTEAKNEEPVASVKCGVIAAIDSVEVRGTGGGSRLPIWSMKKMPNPMALTAKK